MRQIVADLAGEHGDLDAIVADLDGSEWARPTPSEGWDVADQISHLTYFDERAAMAIADPDAFAADLTLAASDPAGYMERHLQRDGREPARLLDHWRGARTGLVAALNDIDPSTRLAWYGPPMSARSFATARLMETWAHGQDIADGLEIDREPTDRLQHIAFLGVRTFGWSFQVHGLAVPETPVFVELQSPFGATWQWGDPDEPNAVSGAALDFCLVVTQRRNVADTGLATRGDVATRWMSIAQAFAGPPGQGRPPGMFDRR